MADGTKRAAAVAFDADCAAQKWAKVGLSAKEAELLSVVRRCVGFVDGHMEAVRGHLDCVGSAMEGGDRCSLQAAYGRLLDRDQEYGITLAAGRLTGAIQRLRNASAATAGKAAR